MSKQIVKYELDLNNLPPLTEQQKVELFALQTMPDSEIDYSDISPLTDDFWKNAIHNCYKPTKASTTVRVDRDVLLWLKSKGKGYQTRINEILRMAMLRELRKS